MGNSNIKLVHLSQTSSSQALYAHIYPERSMQKQNLSDSLLVPPDVWGGSQVSHYLFIIGHILLENDNVFLHQIKVHQMSSVRHTFVVSICSHLDNGKC